MIKEISREEVKRLIDANEAILVEALPSEYYEKGHLPGAVQMDHDEVGVKAENLLPNKNAPIVTYCASDTCNNSAMAADNLVSNGYTNVKKYVGGKDDWIEAGEKLEGIDF